MKLDDLNKINNLIYFTRATLHSLDPLIKRKALDENISRWIKNKSIIKLKNGVYITHEIYEKYKTVPEFHEYLANILRSPSYVTSITVLRSHEVLTEATYAITSVTLKRGESYKNEVNTFNYSNIKKKLFTGYADKHFLNYKYYIATKAKALFDYLYFKSVTLGDSLKNRNLTEELRLTLDSYDKEDFDELKGYAQLTDGKRMHSIIDNIIHTSNGE